MKLMFGENAGLNHSAVNRAFRSTHGPQHWPQLKCVYQLCRARGWGEAGLSDSPTASSLSSLHRRGARRPLSEPDHVFLSSRPLRRFLGPQGCRYLCSSLSAALTSRSERDRRPGRGCPSPTSTNAVFVLGPKPPVYMGTGEARENKFCSVWLNRCCKDHSHLWLGF